MVKAAQQTLADVSSCSEPCHSPSRRLQLRSCCDIVITRYSILSFAPCWHAAIGQMLTTFVEERPVKRLKGEAESTSGEVGDTPLHCPFASIFLITYVCVAAEFFESKSST